MNTINYIARRNALMARRQNKRPKAVQAGTKHVDMGGWYASFEDLEKA